MNVKELRIGNKIKSLSDDKDCECIIRGIDEIGASVYCIDKKYPYWAEIEHFKGIRITKDILAKMWKQDTKWKGLLYKSKLLLSKCKYLHELQNMYYAITNQELNVED